MSAPVVRLAAQRDPAPAVVDASLFVDALIPGTRRDAARDALAGVAPTCPTSVDLEVMSALSRLERATALSSAEADAALSAWTEADIERVDLVPLLPAAWLGRASVRPADGLYLELARATALPLLTTDARLSRAPVRGVTIVLVT